MKEAELRECAECVVCNNKIGHEQSLTFYRVTIQGYILNLPALRKQTGLEMMMGGHAALAQAMGPDEDMALPIGDPTAVSLCQNCAATSGTSVIGLMEMADTGEEIEE